MICLNFGDETFTLKGFKNTASMVKNGLNKPFLMGGGKTLSKIESDSVCSARFIYSLERLQFEDSFTFIDFIAELWRICAHGALIEIRAAAPDNPMTLADPGIVRSISGGTFEFWDAQKRKAIAQNEAARLSCKELDARGINFRMLSQKCHLTQELSSRIAGMTFDDAGKLNAFLMANKEGIASNSFYLVCLKKPDEHFGLVNLPDAVKALQLRDESELNKALPEGTRWRGDMGPYIMRTFDPGIFHGYVAQSIAVSGCWEPSETVIASNIIKMIADQKDHFKMANIGGNIGWYSVLAAKLTGRVSVDVFEPTPATLELLRDNIRINQLDNQVKVHAVALTDKKGEVEFHINHNNDAGNSINHIEQIERFDNTTFETVTVPADSLDNIYAKEDKDQWPDFILIDVEGHEQFVFNGAQKMFEQGFRPLIMAEFCPFMMEATGNVTWWHDLISKWGYKAYAVVNQDRPGLGATTIDELKTVYERLRTVPEDAEVNFLNLVYLPDTMEERKGYFHYKK